MKTIPVIFFCLLWFSLSGQDMINKPAGNNTTSDFSDEDFRELEQKLESDDPTFRFQFVAEKDISFILDAQKRRPQNFIWIDLVNFHFAKERYMARQLENESERRILFENSVQYLTESRITLESVKLADNEENENILNYYRGMLNENIAFAAMGAGLYDKVKQLANDMLINNVDSLSFNYGNTIHEANTLLGRVALKENDLNQAREYLLKSGKCPTSPQLSSFGPSYVLARELLERGEKDIVIDYLDLVYDLWANPKNNDSSKSPAMANNQKKIDLLNRWKEEIMSGKIPEDPKWK
jgi:hypothetical protein